MRSIQISGASAPPLSPSVLQIDRVRRRVSASNSVASLIASLAFGEPVERPWSYAGDAVMGSAAHVR